MCRDPFVADVMQMMEEAGLEPYIYHEAPSSTYIKFDTYIGGSLRISDHPQRGKYAYRWNLRSDVHEFDVKDKGHDCYYYPFHEVDRMIETMMMFKEANT